VFIASCIALGYGLDERGFESRQGLGIFLFTTSSRPALGSTQPPIQWVSGILFLVVKCPGREADHLPPSSAEVTMRVAIPPLPHYPFTACCSVKVQGQFYLYLTFTTTCHWSLSWARWLQSTHFHTISLRSILMLSCHLCLCLSRVFSLQVFRPIFYTHFSYACYMSRSRQCLRKR
jgi:hypothetical protein